MSEPIEEKILLYPDLPEEERREVERYVAHHPEWTRALADAKALDAFIREARSFRDEISDDALAFFAVSRNLPHPPEELREALREMEERVADGPDLQKRLSEIEQRRDALEMGSPADLQFERLTGRSLDEVGSSAQDELRPDPTHIRYLWRIAAAVVVLAAAYSVLYKVGQMRLSVAERLARFDQDELVVEGFEAVRQPDGSSELSPSASAYLSAIEELREAQQSTAGLFPRFDNERLAAARTHLRRVIAIEPAGSFLSGEASYLLAKVHLAAGESSEAESMLQEVVDARGRRAKEAEVILQKLRDEQ